MHDDGLGGEEPYRLLGCDTFQALPGLYGRRQPQALWCVSAYHIIYLRLILFSSPPLPLFIFSASLSSRCIGEITFFVYQFPYHRSATTYTGDLEPCSRFVVLHHDFLRCITPTIPKQYGETVNLLLLQFWRVSLSRFTYFVWLSP